MRSRAGQLRTAGRRGRFHEIHNGLFRRAVLPRRERVLCVNAGEAGEANHEQSDGVTNWRWGDVSFESAMVPANAVGLTTDPVGRKTGTAGGVYS
jgi:hypothetical protein